MKQTLITNLKPAVEQAVPAAQPEPGRACNRATQAACHLYLNGRSG